MKQSDLSIRVALKNYTGLGRRQDADIITSDPTLTGHVPRDRVHKLQARFHGARRYVDVTSFLQANGHFALELQDLERILEDRLRDGPYALHLEALDEYGTSLASADIAFTVDRTPPHPVLFEPNDGGLTDLQRGFIDVALLDTSDIDPSCVSPSNVVIRNGGRTLRVVRAEATSDGLFRYYYEGELRDGAAEVTVLPGQIADLGGNTNVKHSFSFEFTSALPTFNGIPERPRRLQVDPILNAPYNEDSGASVFLHSGEAFLRRVDLQIPGRGFDFRFERTYRSGWIGWSGPHTPLGVKWDFNYNRRLVFGNRVKIRFPDANSSRDIARVDGRGREDLYRGGAPGLFESPPGSYTTLSREGANLVERDRTGNTITYAPVVELGTIEDQWGHHTIRPMIRFTDRNGNTMLFEYAGGQLKYVIDTLGRRIEFFYDDRVLVRVRDFIGREIAFNYDSEQRLESFTSPRVIGTPHGNDFAKGKTERYTYTGGFPHNLLAVTVPNEVARGGPPREIYVYNDDGRVIEHTYGGTNNTGVPAGGTFKYSYMYQPTFTIPGFAEELPIPTTLVTDRNGNRTSYMFSPLGNWARITEHTNRNIRPFDPHYFFENHEYDKDGQRLTVKHHEGNSAEYTFDVFRDNRLKQGNLLKVRRLPDANRGGDQSEIATEYTYEPIYNQRRTVTDPRGNTTVYTFDYQEGSDYARLAARLGTTSEKVAALLIDAGVPMGLGDVNGDGRTDQINGNVVRIEHPTVSLRSDSNQVALEGGTSQRIVELFAYNDFGQLTRHTDPEGNITTYEYYPVWDPSGEAIAETLVTSPIIGGGYLGRVTRDVAGGAGRNSGTNSPPARISTSYQYDRAGNVVKKIDGRGIATEYVVNALNQVVQVVRDAGHVGGMLTPRGQAEGFKYLERYWYDFNNNLVLHQKEDRGNTSNVNGNPPGLQDLPIHAVAIDFGSVPEASLEAHSENGFVLAPRQGSGGSAPSGSGRERLEVVTVGGERGLKLSGRSGSNGVELRREDGTPFTLASIRLLRSERGDGQWVVVSTDGDRQILAESETVLFSGSAWTNIVSIELFPIGNPPDLVIGEWGVYPNPDPIGGETAFADTVYKYDILDNRIETIQEVQNGGSPHFLRTRYRYDANENVVLTIHPEGNASTVVYDERDLRFRQGHGELMPEMYAVETGSVTAATGTSTDSMVNAGANWIIGQWAWPGHFVRITSGKGKGQVRRILSNTKTVLTVGPAWDDPPDATSTYELARTFALLHPDDPTDYDVRGGLACSCASYAFDGNRNLVEMVDASDTDLSPDNNNPELGPGDRTRHVYDGFDRLVRTIDSVGNQTSYSHDAAGNRIREQRFGPTGGPSPTSDEPSTNLLAATTYRYDALNRQVQMDQDLFINTIPTVRTPDVAEGAVDLGKGDLTPGDNKVTTRFEYDRKSRRTFIVEDDGDTFRTLYDGVDRAIKTVDPEGNTVESAYDVNHNLIELRQVEISQETTSGAGTLQSGQSTGQNDDRTLNDTTQSWRRFEWAGRALQITGGTGVGQVRRIIDNTSTQLTVDQDWDDVPDATSSYAILVIPLLDSGQSTGFNTTETLNDATKTWAVDEWAGRTVEVTDGTGAGQIRKITGNNPFQLFVDSAWNLIPDATSRYAIYPRPQPGIAESFLTTYFYDSLDRLERQVDNLGQTTYHRYDSRDNLVAMADAQGPAGGTITRRAFSNGPLTVNAINGFGNVTLFHYDGINRQTRQEIILTASGSGDGVHIGATIEGIKNDAGAPESFPPEPDKIQGGGDGIIRIGTLYDNNSLVSANIDDQGNVTLYLYDNLDRRMAETKGLTTGAGQLTKALILGDREIPAPDLATIDDPAVIPTAKINKQLAAAKARIETVAPLFPSLADQVNDPTTTVYGYDPESNLLILEDENGSRVYIRYDAINRPIAVRAFRAGQNDNHAGDQIFAPDPVSAPSTLGGSSPPVIGTTKQDFQYDGLSRLVMATDNNDPADGSDYSLVTIAYDSLGRAIEEQQQIAGLAPRVVSTGWRAENLRNALTFPNGRVIKYTYDTLDRIRTIADDGASQSLVQYNYIGPDRVLERLYPINGTRLTHLDDSGSKDIGYDGLRRQIALRHLRSDNSTVVGFAHAYDRANNKLFEEKLHAVGDSELYRYDSPYRLVHFERGTLNAAKDAIDTPSANVPQHGTWNLDGAGNWTSVNGETREHSSVNEIASRSPTGSTPVTLTHDGNGNLTDDGDKLLEWDIFNRLRRVGRRSDGQTIAEYTYDALSRRIRKNVSNSGPLDGPTFFYCDGQRVVEEQDGAELLMQQYVHGNYIDEVLVMDRNLDGDSFATGPGDRRLFYHQNGLMHVYALTDAADGVVEGYLYDAYGRHIVHRPGPSGLVDFGSNDVIDANGASGVANLYLFTGRRLDPEAVLLYYRARYLDPGLGCFVGRDPIGVWEDLSNLGNGYTYVGNKPVMWADPFGLAKETTEDLSDPYIKDGQMCWDWSRTGGDPFEEWVSETEYGTICFPIPGMWGRPDIETLPFSPIPDPVPQPGLPTKEKQEEPRAESTCSRESSRDCRKREDAEFDRGMEQCAKRMREPTREYVGEVFGFGLGAASGGYATRTIRDYRRYLRVPAPTRISQFGYPYLAPKPPFNLRGLRGGHWGFLLGAGVATLKLRWESGKHVANFENCVELESRRYRERLDSCLRRAGCRVMPVEGG